MSPQRPHLVVVGNGMAATRLLEEVLALAPTRYQITVFSAEQAPGYNRVLLSPVLGGEKDEASIVTHDQTWYHARGIHLVTGDPVCAIDRRRRQVTSRSGLCVPYHRLVLATGSLPRRLDCDGADAQGITTFRDLRDTRALIQASTRSRAAVVIGGGFLGIEAAEALHRRGVAVTLLHTGEWLLNRQLDREAGALLRDELQRRGVQVCLPSRTASFEQDHRGQVRAVRLQDGRRLKADLVVQAIGITPDVRLARAAGLHCEQGVLTDDTLQTYDPAIYAVGECVQHRQRTFGLVAPLYEQARVCAAHLAEQGHRRYRYRDSATRLKVSGVAMFSAGDIQGDSDLYWRDTRAGVYRRLWLQGDRLRGVVLYGDTRGAAWFEQRLGEDVSAFRDGLLFADCLPERAA
ncbi:FAD-dependent pyridine nucleotide-disulfide oxidoreductase [Alcanivorax sp. S71-1-4]|uniref:NAD(P)/FAD-dependent oxidoreductase n=1 Tax=Alcanivorax sp. S71-1-4 TaxID=1177159 RepID=UPI00135BC31A|nr:FAD-dependent oxidoreductase [Alcanivorax sp. S71-1-4]KAF0809197.1 FAD-dependent pyridine nucleotide-disulfide oxidoreductase [Alcanivorax sp. S71-1-4]